MPATIERSSAEVRETFTKAYQDAVQIHGEGDRAVRAAYAVLKQKFEKLGDRWVAKQDFAG